MDGLLPIGKLYGQEITPIARPVKFDPRQAFSLDGPCTECYKLRAYTYTMVAEAAKHCIKKVIVRNTSHEGVYP
jgi:hypothetical protein